MKRIEEHMEKIVSFLSSAQCAPGPAPVSAEREIVEDELLDEPVITSETAHVTTAVKETSVDNYASLIFVIHSHL